MIISVILKGLFLCSAICLHELGAQTTPETSLSTLTDSNWESYKQEVMTHQHEALGWCTTEKAIKMMDLIYQTNPLVCVEVGVFGGSSIYPTAKALEYLGKGTVYAVDSWSKLDCQQGYEPEDPNYVWWSSLDLEMIYQGFIDLLHNHRLTGFCVPMRMTSKEAAQNFHDVSIDILYLDANHTEESALADAQAWFPKVKNGGYIWFDDVNWESTAKAVAYLKTHCEVDLVRSVGSECLLFKKPAAPRRSTPEVPKKNKKKNT